MKEKIKLIIKGLLLIAILIVPFSILNVKADSGWDSSYDSGGSSSYDSGGSSWSSSSDYDYSGGGGSGDAGSFFMVFVIVIVIIIIIAACNSNTTNAAPMDLNINSYENRYNDISEEELHKYLPDMSLADLRVMAYTKFVDIQNAWMNFDYDKLRELCTDELYNSYVSQLDVLKMKNGKNVMSNFNANSTKIISCKEEDGNVTIKVFMNISFLDYVINTNTNAVIRGTNSRMINNNYEMTFVRSQNVDTDKVHKCPNCGAEITDKASSECKYCHSVIVKESSDFVLSKKTNVN